MLGNLERVAPDECGRQGVPDHRGLRQFPAGSREAVGGGKALEQGGFHSGPPLRRPR